MYNAKQYIFHCVDALLSQSDGDIEVIVVDDCSTDDSYKLCTEKYEGYDNVSILKQPKNMGPGAARNTGIREARGEYISFVDSDDAIVDGAFKKMYAVAKENSADVVHVGGALIPFSRTLPDNLFTMTQDELLPFLLDSEESVEVTTIPDDIRIRVDRWLMHSYHWNIWSKLFRREFLIENDLNFADLSLSEDQNFMFGCLLHAKTYVKMPGFFYIYRISGESLSRGRKNTKFMAKLLNTAFSLSAVMDKTMDGHEFFNDNPEYREKVKAYCLMFLERSYIVDCYGEIPRADMEADETLNGIFTANFGSNAGYVAKQFYDAHDAIPLPEGDTPDMNSYEFWEMMVNKFGKGNVIKLGKR